MSASFDNIRNPVVRFSWGGSFAIFFADDGVHIFGKGSSKAQLKYVILFGGTATALVVITALLWIFYFPATSMYIVEALFLVELWGGLGPAMVLIRKNQKKSLATFPKDPNIQDLLVSEQAHKFLSWSEARQAQFSKFRKKRTLDIYPEHLTHSEPMYYTLGIEEYEKASQVDIFLREKLGDKKVKGTP